MQFYKRAGQAIPVLYVGDNGCGMSHSDVVKMMSFGHGHMRSPEEERNSDVIGRFGVGFKAGSMRLGRDVLVLTQTPHSRSVALLSRSFNQGKDELEVPILHYRRHGGSWMDFDLHVHNLSQAEASLRVIKQFSPFDEYVLGRKFVRFGENCTGTHIYVYNLDMSGSEYTLQWCPNNEDIIDAN
eukprot:Gb_06748 [translate_table: standard]